MSDLIVQTADNSNPGTIVACIDRRALANSHMFCSRLSVTKQPSSKLKVYFCVHEDLIDISVLLLAKS